MPIFTNPANASETYETGKRGKPDAWLKNVPEYLEWRNEANKAKATNGIVRVKQTTAPGLPKGTKWKLPPGLTFTDASTGETWTTGGRGMPKKWVLSNPEFLAAIEKQKTATPEVVAEIANPIVMRKWSGLEKGIVFKDEATGELYTTGKAGRPPKWVWTNAKFIAALDALPPEASVPTKTTKVKETVEGGLNAWRWVGQNSEPGEEIHCDASMCLVVATDTKEALKLLGKRFRNPVTGYEFKTMWREVELPEFIKTAGVYQHNAEKVLTAVAV